MPFVRPGLASNKDLHGWVGWVGQGVGSPAGGPFGVVLKGHEEIHIKVVQKEAILI